LKAIGEPPLMLAISVFAAIADAIHSGTGAAGTARRRRDPGIDLACDRGVGAALNPL
jgi:xanthine dehydrogenase molybdopterin-binding subunit B